MSDLAKRLAPEVLSKANPHAGLLLRVRAAIQATPDLQTPFLDHRGDPVALRDALTPRLAAHFPHDALEIVEAVQYLIDEYQQLPPGYLVLDRKTGRAIACLNENDIYTPAPVPREGASKMTERGPRMLPQIESFLIQWKFDGARDQELHKEALEKVVQTAFLRQEGDPRLYFQTSEGRKQIAESLRRDLPSVLRTGPLQSHLPVVDEAPADVAPSLRCKAVAHVVFPMNGIRHRNLDYDILSNAKALIRSRWSREIAQTLSIQGDVLEAPTFGGEGLWILPPDVAWQNRGLVTAYVAENVRPTHVQPGAGVIVIDPASYECRAREVFDRWEVGATMEYTLYLDRSKIQSFTTPSVEEHYRAEFVS